MQSQHKHTLRVGSWPGPDHQHNLFIQLFCQSLTDSGLKVIHVSDPRRVNSSAIDVLHIHWPEKIFWDAGPPHRVLARLVATLTSMRRLKRSGVSVVWTVHNLKPHDLESQYKLLWPFYLSQLCKLTDGFVTLCPSTVNVVRREIPGLARKLGMYAWHPAYPQARVLVERTDFRRAMGIEQAAHVFAFLGLVRPYKGIEELIQSFRGIADDKCALIIAGAPVRDDYAAKINRLAAGDSRIHLVLRRLTEEELSAFSAAANVIVLPFRDSLHSGSLVHAVSQHTVALTPDTPFSSSLMQAVGGDWIQTYAPPLTPEILLSTKPAAGVPSLDALATSISGPKLAEFYRRLIAQRNVNGNNRVNTNSSFDIE